MRGADVNSAIVLIAALALALGSACVGVDSTGLDAARSGLDEVVAEGSQRLVQLAPSLRSGARQVLAAPKPTKKRPTPKKTVAKKAAPTKKRPTKKAALKAVPKKPPPPKTKPPAPVRKPPPPPIKKPPPPPVHRPPPPTVAFVQQSPPPPVVAAEPPPPVAPPPSEIETITLGAHNEYRSRHQATSNITWDADLAAASQGWAEGCHGITHSYQPGKGENTYFAFATVPEALGTPAFNFQDAVDSWYSEIEFWNFTTGMNKAEVPDADTGHFTQIIWTDTTKVGCGSSYCPGPGELQGDNYPYGFVVICQYLPPGNVNGPDNYVLHVKPLK